MANITFLAFCFFFYEYLDLITCSIDDSIVEGITKVDWYVSIKEIFISDIIFKILAYSLSIIKFISVASEDLFDWYSVFSCKKVLVKSFNAIVKVYLTRMQIQSNRVLLNLSYILYFLYSIAISNL